MGSAPQGKGEAMAFGKGKDGMVKRPSRILLVLLSILVIPFVLVLALTTTVVRPYFAMIDGIMAPNLSTEENRAEPRAMTQEVESEAIVLLENNGALPLAAGSKVNVFGVGVEQFTYGGTGSGAADESVNTSLMSGLRNAGFEVNEDLAA